MIAYLVAGAAALVSLFLLRRLNQARQRVERLEHERRILKERERQAHIILENVSGAIMVLGPDGRILEASPGVLRLLGHSALSLRSTICRTLVHEDDADLYDSLIRTLLASPGAEVRRELRIRHANGSIRHVELLATNLLDDPNLEAFVIHAHDLTELKRAQQMLEAREARLWATMNQVPAILWVADRDLRMIYVLGAGLRSLGYAPERLISSSLETFLGPEGGPNGPMVQRALAGKSGEVEVEVRGRHLRTHMEPFRGEDGQIAGVLGISLDTTQMNRTQAALLEEGRLHRLLSEHGADMVASLDMNGQITYVSPAVETLLGYTAVDFRKRNLADLVHPSDLETVSEAFRQLLEQESMRVSYRVRKQDGSYIWFETLSRVVRDANGAATGIVATSRDMTERKQIEEQLAHLAYHDHLTGLPNRAAFLDRLTASLQTARSGHVAVIYVDIDNFKVINDSLGHQAGDEALIEVGERLRRLPMIRAVARLAGDEFTILLDDIPDADAVINRTEQITAALDAPLSCGGREFQVTFSLGVTLGTPRITQAKDLMREADVALHYAKRQGKARYVLYHPSMTAYTLERLEIDAELRRAIRQQELTLFYQPIVALKSRTVVGAEALIRWRHPRRGWVSPGEFIPIAEQSGYIITLGRWVLEQACREARTWQSKFHPEMPLTVSVNLSAVQVQDPALVDEVAEVLEQTGLEPQCLTLEITETALMQNPEFTRPILQRLKSLGIRLAMDDFGAGHSSLHYLKQFPIDVLKIDRSFVMGLGLNRVDSALVRTVINLAGVLNMAVTAEGVESPEQVAELAGIGCDKAQGYYYAQPVPSTELGPVLAGLSLRTVNGL